MTFKLILKGDDTLSDRLRARKDTTLSEKHHRGETSLCLKDGAQLSSCAFEGTTSYGWGN